MNKNYQIPEIKLKYKKGNIESFKICSPSDAEKVFRKMFDADTLEYREEFICLFLNRTNKPLGWTKISQGGTAGTVIDPKLIFVAALNCGADSIMLAHNHPSGTLRPSSADLAATKKLVSGGKLLDITVHDHLIITSEGYYSFAEHGDI